MDYFEGRSFLDMMLKQSKIIKNQNWKQNVINSLLVSVNLLHKSGIMHRDIYPGNILFKNKEVAMLGNFGSSIQKLADKKKVYRIPFSAPEVMENQEYSFKADIYSLGMTLFHILNSSLGELLPTNES